MCLQIGKQRQKNSIACVCMYIAYMYSALGVQSEVSI